MSVLFFRNHLRKVKLDPGGSHVIALRQPALFEPAAPMEPEDPNMNRRTTYPSDPTAAVPSNVVETCQSS